MVPAVQCGELLPAHVLRGRLQAARIGVTVKIIEGGGQPIHHTHNRDLVNLDLNKCPMRNCWPCQSAAETGEGGASHTRGDTKNAMAKHTANISEKLEKVIGPHIASSVVEFDFQSFSGAMNGP